MPAIKGKKDKLDSIKIENCSLSKVTLKKMKIQVSERQDIFGIPVSERIFRNQFIYI